MNMSGAPRSCWLLCMQYVCFIMNWMALPSLKWRTPYYKLLHGETPDISMIYRFKFYDRVYYKRTTPWGVGTSDTSDSHSSQDELAGFFVGFSESIGHSMTYKILTDDTSKVILRSRIRLSTINPNLQLDLPHDANHIGDTASTPPDCDNTTLDDTEDTASHGHGIPVINPDDLIGRSYLSLPAAEDGQRLRLCIIKTINNDEHNRMQDPAVVLFRATNSDETYEETVSYNQVLQHLEDDDGNDEIWHFNTISGHQGPLSFSDPRYKGSRYNVQVEWDNGEISWEPLTIVASSDPVSVAIYGRDNNLLHLEGWKRFR